MIRSDSSCHFGCDGDEGQSYVRNTTEPLATSAPDTYQYQSAAPYQANYQQTNEAV
jgi:hypothetical protein